MPFKAKISEDTSKGNKAGTTYLVIDRQFMPSPRSYKDIVIGNISLIEESIDGLSSPEDLIDTRRVFVSNCVSARFPALKGAEKGRGVSNALAKGLMSTARGLIDTYGPQGWMFASVQVATQAEDQDGATLGFFSLWITRLGETTLTSDFRTD